MIKVHILPFTTENLEFLRKSKRTDKNLKFIFIFNDENKQFLTISSKSGLDGYLLEPYSETELQNKIHQLTNS